MNEKPKFTWSMIVSFSIEFCVIASLFIIRLFVEVHKFTDILMQYVLFWGYFIIFGLAIQDKYLWWEIGSKVVYSIIAYVFLIICWSEVTELYWCHILLFIIFAISFVWTICYLLFFKKKESSKNNDPLLSVTQFDETKQNDLVAVLIESENIIEN